jgi:hypothetical protein
MSREIPGVTALAAAFPAEWLLYVSLNCYPKNQPAMDIDAFVVLDDQVLILEIKDWNGKLTCDGDQWLVNGRKRGRSSVASVAEKSRKLKTVIRSEIPALKGIWVESRVVLTASATKEHLRPDEQRFVWNLPEACSIAQDTPRRRLLGSRRLGLFKFFQFEQDFDRFTGNPKLFQPSEADWGGYRIVTQDLFVHPQRIWREHGAERRGEPRLKSLVRIWSFDKLPPGLNSPDRRQFIAQREMKAIAHLTAQGSDLLARDRILRHLADGGDEIHTQHFEVRWLNPGWTTLDRFLERSRDNLDWGERVLAATTLLSIVAGLHSHGIAHRDLGLRSIWAGDTTRMAVSGLMSCHVPSEESVADWLPVLRGYVEAFADDLPGRPIATGMQRDVYMVALLVKEILAGRPEEQQMGSGLASAAWDALRPWITRATDQLPAGRFPNAVTMADEFGEIIDREVGRRVDQSLLDRFEVQQIPYVEWPQTRLLSMTGTRSVYVSRQADGQELTVKVWNGFRRNVSAEADLGLMRLFDGVSRLLGSPLAGLPDFVATGLSPVGAFVVYHHVPGIRLDHVNTRTALLNVTLAHQLLTCVTELHALGSHHGDLAPKNILYDAQSERVRLLDAFDLVLVGDGTVKTPAYCPANWELLGPQHLDRYAVICIVRDIVSSESDVRCLELGRVLSAELDRPSIESLEPAVAGVQKLLDTLCARPTPEFLLFNPGGGRAFEADEGRYFLTAKKLGVAAVRYELTAIDSQLVMDVDKGLLIDARFESLPFRVLAAISLNGIEVLAKVTVSRGATNGFNELLDFLKLRLPAVDATDDLAAVEGVQRLNVPAYWNRLTELEEDARPAIEITAELGSRKGQAMYAYQMRGQPFDFDPDATVEFFFTSGRRGGQIDVGLSDGTTLAVETNASRLSVGDVVTLADRRERTSFDRRRKAIQRILSRQSAIPNLIDYFSAVEVDDIKDYGLEVPREELQKYRLNVGQQEAFRHCLRFGPLGLLQGPPGTGKTRFIASFVHWLVTSGGARRVLIASQSHEAVNNAIEALVSLFKTLGGDPSLLRIGSKGITSKIRPYHTQALRERYQQRFEGAIKVRVMKLTSSMGVNRALSADVFEIDRTLGLAATRLEHWEALINGTKNPDDNQRFSDSWRQSANAFRQAAQALCGRTVDPRMAKQELEAIFEGQLQKHKECSPSDLRNARLAVEFARDWRDSLASPHRNFEEFLAKTRTILTATCVGVGQTKIRMDASHFDWVIIDEAARCTPGELAVPAQLGRRVLLVGDHLQLNPMIGQELVERLHDEFPRTARAELLKSDFERAFASSYGAAQGRALNEQYRMHPAICDMVSNVFYEPHHVRLQTSPDRHAVSLFDSYGAPPLRVPITWIDTSRAEDSYERQRENDTTYWNLAEARTVMKVLELIAARSDLVDALEAEDDESPIGIITMYSGQKEVLEASFGRQAWEARFRRLVRIDTVDAYQGKENALVIVSLVRANRHHQAGHVSASHRCNVAVSRARDRLILVGAAEHMWGRQERGMPMREILEFMRRNLAVAEIVSVGEIS